MRKRIKDLVEAKQVLISNAPVFSGKVSEIDLARLAAFVDGEGYVGITKRRYANGLIQHSLRINVTNTSRELMDWIVSRFGGCVWTEKRLKTKPIMRWQQSCRQAAFILEKILPYMIIKPVQARLCLEMQATLKKSGYQLGGFRENVEKEDSSMREELFNKLKSLNSGSYSRDIV